MRYSQISPLVTAFGCAAAIAWPAVAEELLNDNLVVSGVICAGPDCATGDADGNLKGIILEADIPKLHFNSSNSTVIDWKVTATATNGGAKDFYITSDRVSGGIRTPFWIEGLAPTSSLVIDTNGHIGFGTSMPQRELHVINP
ncbi:MAG: hypothetical protein P1U83_13275, partial [Roseovarius sp.]|nr:hypothetical protein [Roseovarius sp.]